MAIDDDPRFDKAETYTRLGTCAPASNKNYDYTTGNQILRVQYTMNVKSFKDGGRYECRSSLGDTYKRTLVKNDSVVLSSMLIMLLRVNEQHQLQPTCFINLHQV